jgi:hypothetical protein
MPESARPPCSSRPPQNDSWTVPVAPGVPNGRRFKTRGVAPGLGLSAKHSRRGCIGTSTPGVALRPALLARRGRLSTPRQLVAGMVGSRIVADFLGACSGSDGGEINLYRRRQRRGFPWHSRPRRGARTFRLKPLLRTPIVSVTAAPWAFFGVGAKACRSTALRQLRVPGPTAGGTTPAAGLIVARQCANWSPSLSRCVDLHRLDRAASPTLRAVHNSRVAPHRQLSRTTGRSIWSSTAGATLICKPYRWPRNC